MGNRVGGESGSYEYEFDSPPPDTLICGICRFYSKTPQLTFCELCIERAKRVDDAFRCPVCRLAFSCLTNKQADRITEDIKCFCIHQRKGCEWQGELIRFVIRCVPERLSVQSNGLPKGLWSTRATAKNVFAP